MWLGVARGCVRTCALGIGYCNCWPLSLTSKGTLPLAEKIRALCVQSCQQGSMRTLDLEGVVHTVLQEFVTIGQAKGQKLNVIAGQIFKFGSFDVFPTPFLSKFLPVI